MVLCLGQKHVYILFKTCFCRLPFLRKSLLSDLLLRLTWSTLPGASLRSPDPSPWDGLDSVPEISIPKPMNLYTNINKQ